MMYRVSQVFVAIEQRKISKHAQELDPPFVKQG